MGNGESKVTVPLSSERTVEDEEEKIINNETRTTTTAAQSTTPSSTPPSSTSQSLGRPPMHPSSSSPSRVTNKKNATIVTGTEHESDGRSSHYGEHPAAGDYGAAGDSWEPDMAKRIRDWVDATERTEGGTFPHCMVAIAGVPGSGRALSSLLLAHFLEEQYNIEAFILPSHGYHYPLDILRTFPNAEDAIYRRGAPDTFDPHALLRDLRLIKGLDSLPPSMAPHDLEEVPENEIQPDPNQILSFPGFRHDKADPQPDKHTFDRSRHQVVIVEGLYLFHHDGDEAWQQISDLFDLKIFLDADVEDCISRLKIRNLCIPGYTKEEMEHRCDVVDRSNADIVLKSKEYADVVVKPVQPSDKSKEKNAVTTEKTTTTTTTTKVAPKSVTLTALALKDTIEEHDLAFIKSQLLDQGCHADWTMDITARPQRPRGDSFQLLSSRSNSFVSSSSADGKKEISGPAQPQQHPISTVVGSWEPGVSKRIIEEIKKREQECKSEEETKNIFPFMVALVGIPGSGKSLSSFLLATALDEAGYPCMVCPHDGYHYPLDYLKTFPDAEDVIYRRGAPDTFDPRALVRDLDRIRGSGRALPNALRTDAQPALYGAEAISANAGEAVEDEVIVKMPAFDHATADPEPDTHIFDRHSHKVVLCEGLYLLHADHGWEDVAKRFDLKIFMNADIDACVERLKIRNCCIPGYTPEEIQIRCERVDRINAMTVAASMSRADIVVNSLAIKQKANNEDDGEDVEDSKSNNSNKENVKTKQ